jgi:hypothetical protein
MNRREACRLLLTLPALPLLAQNRPDSFQAYTDAPRLLLRPARLKLLKRERERRSLRWDQFETLWTGNAPFPELGWVQALRYQIADDREAGTRAVAWAVGPADDIRQIALIADWCEPLIKGSDKDQILAKLRAAMNDPKPLKTLPAARDKVFAAIALSEAQPEASAKALQTIFDGFWNGSFIPALRNASASVSNADAYAMLELMHAFRDNLNFDLRETFSAWFRDYPVLHLMAHYPAPWPGADNEFRIPADEKIENAGPDVRKAALSRAAGLAMVAFDANESASQLLQGWLTNDRFLMRGTLGIPYEFLWANPYQPGLSYYHIALAVHDKIGGQLFVRSSWEDDAEWIGFFGGQLQWFKEGSVTRVDPGAARAPIDIDAAIIFFAKDTKRFQTPEIKAADKPADGKDEDLNVFVVGLDPKRAYHVEVDGEGMVEERADPGGIVFLPGVPGGAGVRFGPAPGAV